MHTERDQRLSCWSFQVSKEVRDVARSEGPLAQRAVLMHHHRKQRTFVEVFRSHRHRRVWATASKGCRRSRLIVERDHLLQCTRLGFHLHQRQNLDTHSDLIGILKAILQNQFPQRVCRYQAFVCNTFHSEYPRYEGTGSPRPPSNPN